MKRYFMAAMTCILVLAIGIVVYGAWLNKQGEKVISDRMNRQALSLQGEKVSVRKIKPVIHWSSVNLQADEMVDAVARVDGIIQNVLVDRQTHVQKGQLLVQVQNEDNPLKLKQNESNIAKAQAEQKRASNTYQRYLSLIRENAVSQQKVDEAEADYKAANAAIDELHTVREQLQVKTGWQNITAPISGSVLMLYRKPGTFVSAGTSVALIGAFDQLRFKVAMQDSQIRAMLPMSESKVVAFPQKDLTKVYHTDYGASNLGMDQTFKAKIMSVTPSLDVPAKLRYVVWEIDNRSGVLEP